MEKRRLWAAEEGVSSQHLMLWGLLARASLRLPPPPPPSFSHSLSPALFCLTMAFSISWTESSIPLPVSIVTHLCLSIWLAGWLSSCKLLPLTSEGSRGPGPAGWRLWQGVCSSGSAGRILSILADCLDAPDLVWLGVQMGDFRGGAWSWAWAQIRGSWCVIAQVPRLLVAPR